METKVKTSRAAQITKRINLKLFVKIPPEGFPGGICQIRKDIVDFKVNILKHMTLFIV